MTERNRDAASISFEAVGKAFAKPGGGTVHALEDVSLRVEPGSITGIIGRSGAGKSTLLRMVNGLERPTSGRVLVGAHDVGTARGRALRDIRRDVGMIFQHFNLLASRTVAGNRLAAATATPDFRKLRLFICFSTSDEADVPPRI